MTMNTTRRAVLHGAVLSALAPNLSWAFDKDGDRKILVFSGKHIPIVNNRRIVEDQPDYLVLLAWHYTEPIVQRVHAEGVRSTLVTALPEFTILAS